MAFDKILCWCERCDEDTLPDVMDLMMGTAPSCGECGCFYAESLADELIAKHEAARSKE